MKYFLLLCSFSLFALEKEVQFEGKLVNLDSTKFSATVLGLEMTFMGKKHFDEINLEALARAGFRVESGTSSSTYSDFNEFKEVNTLFLDEAYLSWKPWDFVEIWGGAINQRIHKSKLFLDGAPFLSLIERFNYGHKNFNLTLSLQQSLPKNSNLASRFGTIDEGAPLFFSERLDLSFTQKGFESRVWVQHFAFDKLSRAVAYKSLFMGNSTFGSGATGTIFQYKFIGWEGGLAFDIPHLGAKLEFSAIINTSAPTEKGRGFIVTPSWKKSWVTLGVDLFYNESDTMPGYYTDKNFGHQNRKGLGLFADIDLLKWGLIGIRYVDARRLEDHTFQVDEKIAFLAYKMRVL